LCLFSFLSWDLSVPCLNSRCPSVGADHESLTRAQCAWRINPMKTAVSIAKM
jgi:hypothetical protein